MCTYRSGDASLSVRLSSLPPPVSSINQGPLSLILLVYPGKACIWVLIMDGAGNSGSLHSQRTWDWRALFTLLAKEVDPDNPKTSPQGGGNPERLICCIGLAYWGVLYWIPL